MIPGRCLLIVLACAAGCAARAPSTAVAPTRSDDDGEAGTFVYAGTAGGEVAALRLEASGTLTVRGYTAVGRPVVAVATDRDGRRVYAATDSGEVAALAVKPRGGTLSLVDRASARGSGTSDLVVDRTGKYVFAVNGRSHAVTVLPVRQLGGFTAGEVYPTGTGAESVAQHPFLDFVLVVNAGARTVAQFAFSVGTGILTPAREPPLVLPPRTVPRRLAFHPRGQHAYLLDDDATVAGFAFEPTSGTLSVLSFGSVSTLPPEVKKGRGLDLVAAPGGRALYGLRRGHDGLAVVAVDPDAGTLGGVTHQPPHGDGPRGLAVDAPGTALAIAYQGSASVVVMRADPASGAIRDAATTPLRSAPLSVAVVTRR